MLENESEKLNWQLVGYSLGAILDYSTSKVKVDKVTIHIHQPRMDHHPEPVDLEAKDLLDNYLPVIKEMIERSEGWFKEGEIPEEDFEKYQKVGSWCQFCIAKTRCQPFVEHKMGNTIELFKKAIREKIKQTSNGSPPTKLPVIEKQDINAMLKKGIFSKEDAAFIALNKSALISFIEQFQPVVIQLIGKGEKFPNIKLTETKGNRSLISDMVKLVKGLKALGISQPVRTVEKVMTISEIESEIGKGKIDHLTNEGETRYKLVPISSEMPEVKFGIKNQSLFKDALLKNKEKLETMNR